MNAHQKTPPDHRVETARQNLRMAAAMRGMNLSEIAVAAGMSRNGLSQFISGRTSISYANLLRVCDVLNLPLALVHRPDAITPTKVRIWQALERMPDHSMARAMEIIDAEAGPDKPGRG